MDDTGPAPGTDPGTRDPGNPGDPGERDGHVSHADGRRETSMERADRNYGELLQELRVTQMGVQILFAFLLGLAFTPRFPDLDAFQRNTYIVTLLLSVTAAALLTAPAALHRVLFRQHAKKQIVDVSSRLAAAGLVVLAMALTGSVLLVVDVVLGRAQGVTAAAAGLLVFTGLWAVLPWRVRSNRERAAR